MKALGLRTAAIALAAAASTFFFPACAPECVDFADCAEKGEEAKQTFTCDNGVCKAGSPFPDAGETGGGTGGGGDTGGGAGGGGGGGDMDAGTDDAGTDDAGTDMDAGTDAGTDMDAGTDAGTGVDAGTDAGTDAGGLFDLVFAGTGYQPHVTHVIRAALVQQSDGGIVGTQTLSVDGGGDLDISFLQSLRPGAAYNLDYYADNNSNNQCGGPDHVWREVIPAVTMNVTINQTHNTNFTPAACNSF